MVLIDGHDSAWQRKFHTAAHAVCTYAESLTGVVVKVAATSTRKSSHTKDGSIDERTQRKIVFMHLNLGHVPWDQLPLRSKRQQQLDICHELPPQNHRFLAIEVIDCTGLEVGLPRIFQLPLQHFYLSTPMILRASMGRLLAQGLEESSLSLQKFQLSSATLTTCCMNEFATGLKHATSLQEVDLSYCLFQGLEAVISEEYVAPTKLKQRKNTEACMTFLAAGLSHSSIFCLKMNRCELHDTAVSILLRHGVRHCGNMQELYLGGNDLGDKALVDLGKYLEYSSGCSLVTLGLSNTFRKGSNSDFRVDNGMITAVPPPHFLCSESNDHPLSQLYPTLALNTSLRVLHLASNGLMDDDMLSLCNAVSQSRVTMLDLKSNRITNIGAKVLAECLPPRLERLWLLGNSVGADGARALCRILERSHVNLIDLRVPIYRHFELDSELEEIQKEASYFLLLNKGGRRILLEEDRDNDSHCNVLDSNNPEALKVPPALWALILDRVNRTELVVPWGQVPAFNSIEANRAEVLYYLLRHASMLRQHRKEELC